MDFALLFGAMAVKSGILNEEDWKVEVNLSFFFVPVILTFAGI